MKVLKFHQDLVPLVLAGSKTSTWRLYDEKDLSQGDKLEMYEFGHDEPFAFAVITKVIEKSFVDLSPEDKVGHEDFDSDEHMYETYSGYYSTKVGPDTRLKIIWFVLQNPS